MTTLDEIRARLEAVPQWPWHDSETRMVAQSGHILRAVASNDGINVAWVATALKAWEAIRAFVAHAPTDLAFLLAAIECKDAHIEVWRERAEKAGQARDAARADAIRTLASAIHKFAPELSLELTRRGNVAKGEAEAALEEFLTALSPSDRIEPTPKEGKD
jgi:hypothetical protein